MEIKKLEEAIRMGFGPICGLNDPHPTKLWSIPLMEQATRCMMWTLLTTLTFLLLSEFHLPSASPISSPKHLENPARQTPEAKADLPVNPNFKEVRSPQALDSRFLSQNTSSQLRSLDSPSVVGNTVNLQWVPFNGSVPSDTVSIMNDYASRTDYVCKAHCEPGFYNPSKGSRCFYAYGGKEYYSYSFDILVNRDNFEFLEWVMGLYGSLPSLAIKSCEDYDAFVGKNRYGLGKVVPKHSAFFLPWEGKEYYYKYYDVLSINPGSYSQKISHFIYDTNQANLLEQPPEVLKISSLDNYECQSIKRTVTLEATTMSDRRWDVQHSAMYGISINVTVGIPSFLSESVRVSMENMFTTTLGEISSTPNNHSFIFEETVQPNYSCSVKMVGKKVTTNIPFTARLSRTYWNGRKEQTTVVGKYQGEEIREVKVEVERCEQIPNAQPCPSV
ncbi:natterin-3-like [Erpetoichthys calabaricus]|uniref:natterin-3-like n=1 Tax=Erpetoichthys calabaricus TaxID=27687 RepID=UPI00109F454A|nr:natterin-3-like [Erpetoichthys calabaricus]